MNCCAGLFRSILISLLVVQTAAADEGAWDERLAAAFSGRLREIREELAESAPRLARFPGIPIDDQGGTGGFSSIQSSSVPLRGARFAVELRWSESAAVDLVALVPARRYDARGLDAQYGMPDSFKVELIDAEGAVLANIAQERNARSHPVRKGHPFVYQIVPAVEAAGMRITAQVLFPDSDGDENFVHAWAEAFVFSGDRNLASGAEVKSLGGTMPSAPWQWKPEFLVDGQTPLGLPEVPAGEHRNIGWISEGRGNAHRPAALTVDLGKSVTIDAVRLVPAKRPTSDLPSGFGFPRKLEVSISDTGSAVSEGGWQTLIEGDFRNPGHNPVELSFDATEGRYVRIDALELWKAFDSYPAFFALSEVEVLAGDENLALGKAVRSSDGMLNIIAPGGRFWSGAALSDGFGPDGRLVSTRDWLLQLDQRLQLETRLYDLRMEASRLVGAWRRTGQMVMAALILAGAFLIIVLPIRYRIHANRELVKVRERIAGDLHDEVGSNLGSIQMFADLAEGRSGPSDELKRIQRIAAETVSAVRDIVWLLRPGGDHRIATVEHLRETSSIMLESMEWEFTANEEAWKAELPEDETRHLFLFFREALHNILRHSKATRTTVRVEASGGSLMLSIKDDGVGIDPEKLERPATLRALRQRTAALAADLKVDTRPGDGTGLRLTVPLEPNRKRRRRTAESPAPAEKS